MKSMIFHIPFRPIERVSGTNIRPLKMLSAFENLGYEVDFVMGSVAERRQRIKKIKEKIKAGHKYAFVYTEAHTLPTLLTEKDHLPRSLNMDFSFFKFCRKKGLKIGLYYRDVFWNVKGVDIGVSPIVGFFMRLLYRWDLWNYDKILNIFYLQSRKMKVHIPIYSGGIQELPPGLILRETTKKKFDNKMITILHVGGLDNACYDATKLFIAVRENPNVRLLVCCRKDDWARNKEFYADLICDRVEIHHKQGDGLADLFNRADLAHLFFKDVQYRDFVLPLKLFEFMEYKKPIIAIKNSSAGDFVKSHDIGWVIDHDVKELAQLLNGLTAEAVAEKMDNMEKVQESHTWLARARKVEQDLSDSADHF